MNNTRSYFKIIFRISLMIIFITGISSCDVPGLDNKTSLTDEKIEKYLNVYTKMREKAPDVLEKLNENGESIENGKEGFATFEKIIKEEGLENYAEFVRLNAKIGVVFSVIQASKGIEQFEKLNTDSKAMIDENVKDLEEMLDDPDIPEESKKEIRKSITELEKGKVKLSENLESNKEMAKMVMEKVNKLSKRIVSEQDIEVVMRNEDKIMEAYTGFPMPKGE